jgi:Sulfotransferase domain
MGATPATTFTRKMPPLPARCVMGVVMFGVIGPFVRLLEKSGRAPVILTKLGARRRRTGLANNPFSGYTPTSHDVFVAAHVKSGTNWMMQIAHQLAFHGHGEYDHIHNVVAWPDTKMMGPMRNYAIPVEDPSVWMASPEQKRVIKTHCDFDWLPYSPEARYIIVIRDPKDVFVSSYFFFIKNGLGKFTGLSPNTWFEIFLSSGVGPWTSWPVNTAGYWAQRHRPNVLIVSFKSMKEDLRSTVRKVADFMNVRAGNEVIERVCQKSSFDYMKQIDDKFRAWEMIPWISTAAPMMRRGNKAVSSELLTPAQQQRMDRHFIGELRRLGSDFPYEEFCDINPALKASAS